MEAVVSVHRSEEQSRPGLVTQAEFARIRGVSREAVRRAVQTGRIQLEDGLVDPVQASRDWDRNTNKARMPKRARATAAPAPLRRREVPPPAPPGDGEQPDQGSSEFIPDFLTSQATHEFHKARLAELKANAEEGRLVDAERVKKEIFATYRNVRAAMETIPDRIAAIVAGETNPATVHQLLLKEIRAALEEASDGLDHGTG